MSQIELTENEIRCIKYALIKRSMSIQEHVNDAETDTEANILILSYKEDIETIDLILNKLR